MSSDSASTAIGRTERSHDRLLMFELAQTQYALAVSGVSGLATMGPLRRVPRTHEAVLGLTEWRGNALTVIDLPRLLGVSSLQGNDCLIRLAAPWHRTALRIPATVRLASQQHGSPSDAGRARGAGEVETLQILEVAALMQSVEAKMRGRG